jgi:hypothetical protein
MTPDVRHLAIFARNWPLYLDEATKLCKNRPNRRLAYQSRQRWVTAASALEAAGPRKIYFAEIDGGPRITHVAELVEVQVDASRRNQRTKQLLELRPPKTRREVLWGRTVYIIRRCQKIRTPFSMARLPLASAHKRLSPAFKYSYALVKAPSAAA